MDEVNYSGPDPSTCSFGSLKMQFEGSYRYRFRRAKIRLLRTAACYRRTLEVLRLEDPFGNRLRSAVDGITLKLWSRSYDGKDSRGRGAWDTEQGYEDDLVLEIHAER